ncbi:DUF5664 domain-containing protein [Akkermansiaceae bacterium]|nr:DUF5664 domain-containing protein [Akkermansiaceae bacterium]
MNKNTQNTDPKGEADKLKTPLQLLPPIAMENTALALRDGAEKYGEWNWRENQVGAMTYIGAALRHIAAFVEGEQNASDSNVHHLGHAMASLAILQDAQHFGTLIDNRPPRRIETTLVDKIKEEFKYKGVNYPIPDGYKIRKKGRIKKGYLWFLSKRKQWSGVPELSVGCSISDCYCVIEPIKKEGEGFKYKGVNYPIPKGYERRKKGRIKDGDMHFALLERKWKKVPSIFVGRNSHEIYCVIKPIN